MFFSISKDLKRLLFPVQSIILFSEKTALIIQVLKTLGPERILDWHIEQIKNQLTDDDKITIFKESRFTFKWMQPFLMRIAEGKFNG